MRRFAHWFPWFVLGLGIACAPDGEGTLSSSQPQTDSGTAVVPGSGEPPSQPQGGHDYACVEVATAPGDGFFSLLSAGGRLYAGLFGYGQEDQSMLWGLSESGRVQPGILGVGESVCAMQVFEGALYANTENSGNIYRSTDGNHWSLVYDGQDGAIGCALEAFDGQLYAVNYDYDTSSHGRILRSSDGQSFTEVWSSGAASDYLRELVVHDGVLHAYGTGGGRGFWLRSTNGTDWTREETPSRFFRGISWRGAHYSAATDYSSHGPAGIYRTIDGVTERVYEGDRHYVTELHPWDDALFAATSAGWKGDVGTSTLLMSRDGLDWEQVCELGELAAWAVEVHEDHLYVGTWEYEAQGRLYRVDIVEE